MCSSDLWGPAHGGANEAALAMLAEIGTVDKIPAFVEKVKDKNSKVRLMGFGHRVYKNYDPRARLIKATCDRLLAKISRHDPIFDIAQRLEEVALADEYFIQRKLYPNVDFYSGIIYQAMGFPVEFFPVLFAIPRTAGWLAHFSELLGDKEQKISRPRQWYTGTDSRDYVALANR